MAKTADFHLDAETVIRAQALAASTKRKAKCVETGEVCTLDEWSELIAHALQRRSEQNAGLRLPLAVGLNGRRSAERPSTHVRARRAPLSRHSVAFSRVAWQSRGMSKLLAALAVLLLPLVAFAQTAPDAPLAYGDALGELVKLIESLKGASALAITLAVTQALMLALRTPLADKLGKWKLTALLGLSCVLSLISAKIAGASWGAAFLSGPLLAAVQVFGHQLFTQFTEKKPA